MVKPKALPERRDYSANPEQARAEQAREDLVRTLRGCPFLRGRLVSVHLVSATRKEVRHDLGVAAACIVIRQNYDAGSASWTMAESATRATDEKTHLALIADATCDLDLWFYARASLPIDAGQGQSL